LRPVPENSRHGHDIRVGRTHRREQVLLADDRVLLAFGVRLPAEAVDPDHQYYEIRGVGTAPVPDDNIASLLRETQSLPAGARSLQARDEV